MTEINNFLAFIQSSYRPKGENIKSVKNKHVKPARRDSLWKNKKDIESNFFILGLVFNQIEFEDLSSILEHGLILNWTGLLTPRLVDYLSRQEITLRMKVSRM